MEHKDVMPACPLLHSSCGRCCRRRRLRLLPPRRCSPPATCRTRRRSLALLLPQHIRDITDPEHPYTLEQLSVVSEEAIEVDDTAGTVQVRSACERSRKRLIVGQSARRLPEGQHPCCKLLSSANQPCTLAAAG